MFRFVLVVDLLDGGEKCKCCLQKSGALQIGHHKGALQPGEVYSGGEAWLS